jgi:hypothetical protein
MSSLPLEADIRGWSSHVADGPNFGSRELLDHLVGADQGDAGAGAAEEYRRCASSNTRSDDCDIVLGV